VLPGDGRDMSEDLERLHVAGGLFLSVDPRQQRGVVVDDRVGDQPRALVLDLLFGFGLHPEFAGVDVGDGATETMIGLATVQGLLHALA
jgi:hypothetical protein